MIETFKKCLDLDLTSSQESLCQSTARLFKFGRTSILSSLCSDIAEGIIPFPRDKRSSCGVSPLPALPVWPGPFVPFPLSSVWSTDLALIHHCSMVQNKSAPPLRNSFESCIFGTYKAQPSWRWCCLSPPPRCHQIMPGAGREWWCGLSKSLASQIRSVFAVCDRRALLSFSLCVFSPPWLCIVFSFISSHWGTVLFST